MKTKTILMVGMIAAVIGALDAIIKLLGDIGNWFNTLPLAIQWLIIIGILYWIYKRSK